MRRVSRKSLSLISNPTPQAGHHAVGAIRVPLLLNLLVAGQINVFRQWRPFAHPLVGLCGGCRAASTGRCSRDDPWLVVDEIAEGMAVLARGSDRWLTDPPYLRSILTHGLRLSAIRWQFTHFRRDQDGYDWCTQVKLRVRRSHHRSGLRSSLNGVRPVLSRGPVVLESPPATEDESWETSWAKGGNHDILWLATAAGLYN